MEHRSKGLSSAALNYLELVYCYSNLYATTMAGFGQITRIAKAREWRGEQASSIWIVFGLVVKAGNCFPMTRVKEKYRRRSAEQRFAHVYETAIGDRCVYCGMPNDGKYDHQPPVYVLHRFADGGLVTKRAIRERFGHCKLVPCCTICNMGLGTYHGADDNERRQEIVNWFLEDDRFPEDRMILETSYKLVVDRLHQKRGNEIYQFAGVGRVIYIWALVGMINGDFDSPDNFPAWLKLIQSELAEWLRGASRRKSQYFLDMANLESYELMPHARDDPRGQFKQT